MKAITITAEEMQEIMSAIARGDTKPKGLTDEQRKFWSKVSKEINDISSKERTLEFTPEFPEASVDPDRPRRLLKR